MQNLPSQREMHRAFLSGDASYDGVFFTGVKTTGIFCRPSCTARKPRPENVEFFATHREAVFSGYRPCKRCARSMRTAAPAWVGRLLERLEADPASRIRAADLRGVGVDPARARRYFLKHYGMTFQAYCRAAAGRCVSTDQGRRRRERRSNCDWFESESGFRTAFARAFGTTPAEAVGADAVALDWIASPVGPLVAGATSEGVCLLGSATGACSRRSSRR